MNANMAAPSVRSTTLTSRSRTIVLTTPAAHVNELHEDRLGRIADLLGHSNIVGPLCACRRSLGAPPA